jgi:hypothetical protein
LTGSEGLSGTGKSMNFQRYPTAHIHFLLVDQRHLTHNMLLRHLESTFDEQDIALKGMYNKLCVYK